MSCAIILFLAGMWYNGVPGNSLSMIRRVLNYMGSFTFVYYGYRHIMFCPSFILLLDDAFNETAYRSSTILHEDASPC
jgi:hypothetical protein